jgi:hypothetical protein
MADHYVQDCGGRGGFQVGFLTTIFHARCVVSLPSFPDGLQ